MGFGYMKSSVYSAYVSMPLAGSYLIHGGGDNFVSCFIYTIPNTAPTDNSKYKKLF